MALPIAAASQQGNEQKTKNSTCRPGLQISHIPIALSIHGMCRNKCDPWGPHCGSDLALTLRGMDTGPLGLSCGGVGSWSLESWGLQGGAFADCTCSGTSDGCLIRLRSRKFVGQVNALSSSSHSSGPIKSIFCWPLPPKLPLLWGSVLGQEWCLGGWCMSSTIRVNARTQGFLAEPCVTTAWSMLFTSLVLLMLLIGVNACESSKKPPSILLKCNKTHHAVPLL